MNSNFVKIIFDAQGENIRIAKEKLNNQYCHFVLDGLLIKATNERPCL